MRFFDELGNLIADRWSHVNFDESVFPEIATGALEEMPPARTVNLSQLVEWVGSTDQLPAQDMTSNFGQPPLVVYRGRRFYIEVLVWVEGTTGIHQHGFAGAFHVVAGSSLQTHYEFEAHDRVNSRLLIGNVGFQSAEYLPCGSTRPIVPGSRFIHSVFHLDYPTVSLVVRTPAIEAALPQYEYRPPYLAWASNVTSAQLTRHLQLLAVLRTVNHPDYLPHLHRLVSTSDFETVFHALDRHAGFLDAGECERLIEAVRGTHGNRADVLRPVLENGQRIQTIAEMRERITNPEHRFLLAMLMNLPNREAIFNMVQARYGGDPAERIAQWVRELNRQGDNWFSDPRGGGALSKESTMAVFSCLLTDPSPDQALELLKQEYNPRDIAAEESTIRRLCAAFQQSPILRPLFAGDKCLRDGEPLATPSEVVDVA